MTTVSPCLKWTRPKIYSGAKNPVPASRLPAGPAVPRQVGHLLCRPSRTPAIEFWRLWFSTIPTGTVAPSISTGTRLCRHEDGSRHPIDADLKAFRRKGSRDVSRLSPDVLRGRRKYYESVERTMGVPARPPTSSALSHTRHGTPGRGPRPEYLRRGGARPWVTHGSFRTPSSPLTAPTA